MFFCKKSFDRIEQPVYHIFMSNRLRNQSGDNFLKTITLKDIADELGISKSTVSRVLSGTGRISEETRKKVLDYAADHDYRPNLVAKGLATSRSYNIGVILPDENVYSDIPFFHRCLAGITREAASKGYDPLILVSEDNSTDHLERVLMQNKADGVIITRLMEDDSRIRLLKETSVPFIVIGSGTEDGVCQVDTDNEDASFSFTEQLIERGCRRLLLLCGPLDITVNRLRKAGFEKAVAKYSEKGVSCKICAENNVAEDVIRNLTENASFGADCMIFGDDVLCSHAMEWIEKNDLSLPDNVQIASLYNSSLLERYGCVHAVDADASAAGKAAAELLLKKLAGENVSDRNVIRYSLVFRDSSAARCGMAVEI